MFPFGHNLLGERCDGGGRILLQLVDSRSGF